jgi:copper chaperone
MSHTYEFNVSMSCGGCSGAVDRAIKKLDGKYHGRP